MSKRNKKNKQGMSLVEILIVISVFAVLGVLTTRSVITTLRGTRKSDSQIKVRENLNYALSIIERQLRSAEEVSPCPNPDVHVLDYVTNEGINSSFSCLSGADGGYIASGSSTLTSSDVDVVVDDCSFVCEKEDDNSPARIYITINAIDAALSNVEGGNVKIETEIVSRNY